MARVIIRYSFNGKGICVSRKRGAIRDILGEGGFKKIGTASWEHAEKPLEEASRDLQRVLLQLAKMPKDCELDHLWIYVDDSD